MWLMSNIEAADFIAIILIMVMLALGWVNSTSGPSLRHSRREIQRQDFPNLIIGYAKDTKPTGPRDGLQSGGNIHPATKQITRRGP